MDVWLTICHKTVPKCHYCHEPIHLGEVMVAGKLWFRASKEGGDIRRWIKHFRWHAQKETPSLSGPPVETNCWLLEGLAYLAEHPYVETRGRKQLQLSTKQKDARLKILRQRARLVQKLKTLMEAPLDSKDLDVMIKIGSQIEELKERIGPLGGVPPSWE